MGDKTVLGDKTVSGDLGGRRLSSARRNARAARLVITAEYDPLRDARTWR